MGSDEVDTFDVGETYRLDELPDNDMDFECSRREHSQRQFAERTVKRSGNVEMVGDNLWALALPDGRLVEFEMAVKCTCVTQIDMDTGEVDEVLKGERQ